MHQSIIKLNNVTFWIYFKSGRVHQSEVLLSSSKLWMSPWIRATSFTLSVSVGNIFLQLILNTFLGCRWIAINPSLLSRENFFLHAQCDEELPIYHLYVHNHVFIVSYVFPLKIDVHVRSQIHLIDRRIYPLITLVSIIYRYLLHNVRPT